MNVLEYAEQHRNDKQQGNRTDKHTTHGTHAQRNVAVGTYARSKHHREQTENHGERRHQNRAQTHFRRRDGRLCNRHSVVASIGSIFRQQDGGLGEKSDKHNQTRLHVDVVFQSEHLREQEAASQSERNGKNHGQRNEQTFVERTQNQVDEHDTDDEHDGCRVAGRSLLARHASELKAVACGQHFLCYFAYGLNGLAGTVAVGSLTVDGNGREQVEARQAFRTVDTCQCQILSQWRHFSVGVADKHIVERSLVETELRRSLHHDTVELGETVEVGSVVSADVARKNGKHVRRRYFVSLAESRIDFHQILRIFGVESRVGARHFRTLVQTVDHLPRVFLQIVDRAAFLVLNIDFKTAADAVARNHRLSEGADRSVGDMVGQTIDFFDDSRYAVFVALAFVPGTQTDDELSVRRAFARREAVTDYFRVNLDFRNFFQFLFHFLHHFFRFGKARSRCRLHVDEHGSHVFRRNKAGFGGVHQQNESAAGNDCQRACQPFVFQEEHYAELIAVDKAVESGIESDVETR